MTPCSVSWVSTLATPMLLEGSTIRAATATFGLVRAIVLSTLVNWTSILLLLTRRTTTTSSTDSQSAVSKTENTSVSYSPFIPIITGELLCGFLGLYSGNSNATGGLNNQGGNGNFWSSTSNSLTNARNLNFNATNANPQNNNNKFNGFTVRCLKTEKFVALQFFNGRKMSIVKELSLKNQFSSLWMIST